MKIAKRSYKFISSILSLFSAASSLDTLYIKKNAAVPMIIIIIETSDMKSIDKVVHKLQKNPGVVHTETAITHRLHELEDEYHRENLRSIGGIE